MTTSSATTLIEAVAPGRTQASEADEDYVHSGVERLMRAEDDRRHEAAPEHAPRALAPEAPGGSEAAASAEAAEGNVIQRCVVPGCEKPRKAQTRRPLSSLA
jgi:hypothetical protein